MTARGAAPVSLPARLVTAAGLVAVAGAYALRVLPWRCPLAWVTGHPCPACGVTRAAHHVAAGALADATRVYPLWWVVLPVGGLIAATDLGGFVVTGRWGLALHRRWVRVLALAICVAMFVVWIARLFGAFGGPAPV